MGISQKTLDEMNAGAAALAEKQGRVLDPEHMERLRLTHERNAALRRWERDGRLDIEIRSTPTRGPDECGQQINYLKRDRIHHVKDRSGRRVAEFWEDPAVLDTGGYPGEVLVAQIALAIAALGGGDG